MMQDKRMASASIDTSYSTYKEEIEDLKTIGFPEWIRQKYEAFIAELKKQKGEN